MIASFFTLAAPSIFSIAAECADGQDVGDAYKITFGYDGVKLASELQRTVRSLMA